MHYRSRLRDISGFQKEIYVGKYVPMRIELLGTYRKDCKYNYIYIILGTLMRSTHWIFSIPVPVWHFHNHFGDQYNRATEYESILDIASDIPTLI